MLAIGAMATSKMSAAEKLTGNAAEYGRKHIGFQSYGLGSEMLENPAYALKEMKSYGYDYLELAFYYHGVLKGWNEGSSEIPVKDFKKMADDAGLKILSSHVTPENLAHKEWFTIFQDLNLIDAKCYDCPAATTSGVDSGGSTATKANFGYSVNYTRNIYIHSKSMVIVKEPSGVMNIMDGRNNYARWLCKAECSWKSQGGNWVWQTTRHSGSNSNILHLDGHAESMKSDWVNANSYAVKSHYFHPEGYCN